jgi:thiamine biosynthesis protein ThiS
MEVMANGRPVDLHEGATVTDLLAALGLSRRVVAVDRNGQPVERSAIATVVLRSGDRLEIVRAVAGG